MRIRGSYFAYGRLSALAFVSATTSCLLVHTVNDNPDLISTTQESAPEKDPELPAALSEGWWKQFEDPQLETLLSEAFAQNLDAARIRSRFREAVALRSASRAGHFPEVSVGGNVSRARTNAFFGSQPVSFENDSFSLSLDAAYTPDVFGAQEAEVRAAGQEEIARTLDYVAFKNSLAFEVSNAWFALRSKNVRAALVRAQHKDATAQLKNAKAQYTAGLASHSEYLQLQQQHSQTLAELPAAEFELQQAQSSLGVLLGRMPEDWNAVGPTEFHLPEAMDYELTMADLLRRPDVEAARRRFVSQDYRVASAIAQRLPSVRLSGSVGYRAFSLGTLFDQLVFNVLGSLVAPLIDGGRRRAVVAQHRARLEVSLADFKSAVLRAAKEVQDAVRNEEGQRTYFSEVSTQHAAARRALAAVEAEYERGIADYETLLRQRVSARRASQQEVMAQFSVLAARLSLCRALGAGFGVEAVRKELKRG